MKTQINWIEEIPCLWITRINIVKVSTLIKAIGRVNAMPIKIPMAFCTEIEKKIPKDPKQKKQSWEKQKTKQKKQAQGNTFPAIKLYYKAIVTKIVWCWQAKQNKTKHTDTKTMEQNQEPRSKTTHIQSQGSRGR